MIICIIISIILWIIYYNIFKSVKISRNEYYYDEKTAEYLSFHLWHLILIILTLFIPIFNLITPAAAIFTIVMVISCEDNVGFAPTGIFSKFIKILNKKL